MTLVGSPLHRAMPERHRRRAHSPGLDARDDPQAGAGLRREPTRGHLSSAAAFESPVKSARSACWKVDPGMARSSLGQGWARRRIPTICSLLVFQAIAAMGGGGTPETAGGRRRPEQPGEIRSLVGTASAAERADAASWRDYASPRRQGDLRRRNRPAQHRARCGPRRGGTSSCSRAA